MPESYKILKQQIVAQLCKGKDEEMDFAIKTNQYSISYEDETGDQINISDDEDLQAAYDLTESTPQK